jgi:hypothetical protein
MAAFSSPLPYGHRPTAPLFCPQEREREGENEAEGESKADVRERARRAAGALGVGEKERYGGRRTT